MTRDHSLVEEMLELGELKFSDIDIFPYKNVITKAIGASGDIKPDIRASIALPGDYYMLCSDGLTGKLNDAEIASYFEDDSCVESITQRLTLAVKSKGNYDDISMITLKLI